MTATLSYYHATFLDINELEAQHGGELTLAEYDDLLGALGAIAKGHQWWVGDALVYGEKRFDEDTFSQAAEGLGLEPHTLTNWRWVAASVAPSRRRENLTWSHHAEVARLSSNVQNQMLQRAENEQWTVRQLRDHVALTYPQTTPQMFGDDDGRQEERQDVNTAKRLEEIERKWDAAGARDRYGHLRRLSADDLEDVRYLIGLAKRATRSGQ